MPTFDLLAARLARAMRPLAYAMDSEEGIHNVVADLGWELPLVPASLTALGQDLVQLNSSLAELNDRLQRADAGETADVDEALRSLVLDLAPVVAGFHGLPGRLRAELPANFIAATHIDEEFVDRIFDWLISYDLSLNSPLIYRLLRLAGVIETTDQVFTEDTLQPLFQRHEIHWHRLFQLLDPKSLARDVYGWGTPQLNTERLFAELVPLSMTLSMPAEHRYASAEFTQRVAPGSDPAAQPASQLWIPVFRSDTVTLFVVTTALPKASADELQGLSLALVPTAGGELQFSINDQLELKLTAETQIGTGASLILRPDRAPDVVLDMDTATGTNLTSGNVAATLTWRAAEWAKPDGVSTSGRTQITARSVSFGLGAEVSAGKVDVFGEIAVDDGKLIVAPPAEDGLLSSVLTKDGLTAPFSLGVRWSQDGLHFRGSAGLTTTIPVSLSLGPLLLQSLNISAQGDQNGFTAEVGVAVSIELGPVLLTIEGIGIKTVAEAKSGNLGPIDVDIDFKPPTGAGLAIKAPMITGGGSLRFDPQKGEYGGILELSIAERISVKGFALLTTRTAEGRGYSLVVLIFVEGFTPIPLGLGFSLTGIGGLLAINRTFDEEVLRAGLKNHTLDSVMFPKDPIRNAPQILSNLNRVFPPANGRHLFGPMVQISWGTPALITAELAIVLEFGARRRLLLLAQILSVLPKPDKELVRLQMDAIGVLDFDQGTASLDATLHGSRLLNKFPLTGDMALRLKWSSSPNFALAVGGLHPAFNPPPNFPKLERIAINLSAGDNPKLRCEAYFALTSNTVQFGARAELQASAAGFTVHGEIGFDVLIQFDPFFFLAEFYAQLQLKRGSTNLFKVRLEGSLAGPRPLHIKGKATFEIFWWDVSIRIDKTLVSGEKPPLPEPIDVLPRLKEALGNPGNWVTNLPNRQSQLVELRADATATADVLLHPLGTLTIKQGVVPLNVDITRFGQTAPAGERRFSITNINLGGDDEQSLQKVKDFFAPAQFFELNDADKLSRPSFESLEAGVTFGSDELTLSDQPTDWLEVKTIEFETWIVDDETNEARRSAAEQPQPQQPKLFYQLSHALLLKQASFGAAGSSALRRTGRAKYRSSITGKYQITKEGWKIIATEDLTEQSAPGLDPQKPASYSEAAESLRKLKQHAPEQAARLKILRLSELVKS